ncbi:hypothetical protein Fcan01_00233 [Folsomia candida]|uniref:Uncharacterized protein n=1 Tax=Folsomia candida TaxID=158441 RepID=A0A226EW31_FOLCA|nr:hypothetical protein Fcan01_00233 [Folsomia candida]
MDSIKEIPTTDPNLKVFPSDKGKCHVATYKGYFYTYHRDGVQRTTFRRKPIRLFTPMGQTLHGVTPSTLWRRSRLVPPVREIPDLSGRFLGADDEDFLKIDVTISTPNERVLVFCTNKNLDWLQASDHWFCDGTFKSSPTLFEQLIVIHGLRFDGNKVTCFPLVYVLAPNCLQRTYSRILAELKSLKPTLAPISVMTDFESGLRNAFVAVFPNVTMRGWDPELKELISTEPDWALELRKLIALSFVPQDRVVAAFEEMESSRPFRDNSELSVTWIILRTRGLVPSTVVDIEKLHCSQLTRGIVMSLFFKDYPKLTISVSHLTVPSHQCYLLNIQHWTAGTTPNSSSSQSKNIEKLKHLVERYGSVSTMEFLKCVAYNFSL